MSTAAVVGTGTMGAGIAAVLARAGYRVSVVDADLARAREGLQRALDVLQAGVSRGKIEAAGAEAAAQCLNAAGDMEDLPLHLDVIIEAVPEQQQLKRDVLVAAERRQPRLLASNTSGIAIDILAGHLSRPQRFVGLHFFNPVPVMPLVEVVRGHHTADDALSQALGIVDSIGKTAVVVADAPGFASTRLGIILGLEAMRMVEEGVATPENIDTAMTLGYGHPVGPLRLTDMIGLDIRLDSARNLQAAYGERFAPPQILENLVAQGYLGKKSGRGFYHWD